MWFKEMFQEYIDKGWHYANPELFDVHLDYEINQRKEIRKRYPVSLEQMTKAYEKGEVKIN